MDAKKQDTCTAKVQLSPLDNKNILPSTPDVHFAQCVSLSPQTGPQKRAGGARADAASQQPSEPELEQFFLALERSANDPYSTVNLANFASFKMCLPPLTQLSQLQKLALCFCWELTQLPESLGDLAALRELILRDGGFTCLPESLGGLSDLKKLDLQKCNKLTCLPESLGNLRSLQTLQLNGCEVLTCLPASLGNLASLQTLALCNCWKLTQFPESFGRLTALQTLNLIGCPLSDQPVPEHVEQPNSALVVLRGGEF
jgi:hypothetical protein